MNSKQFFWHELPWLSPLSIAKTLWKEGKYPTCLVSGKTVPQPHGGRFSYILFEPEKTVLAKSGTDYFRLLQETLGGERTVPENTPEVFQQFCGGLVGFLSYDFAHELEEFSQNKNPRSPEIPLGLFHLSEIIIGFDHFLQESFLGCWQENKKNAEQFFARFSVDFLTIESLAEEKTPTFSPHMFRPEISSLAYHQAIEAIQEELKKGNAFQVNFSQKWQAETPLSNFDLFSILVEKNPAPMMFFQEWKDMAVISCSPERLFSLEKGNICTQPIAGTRRRGANKKEDEELTEELQTNSKEKAEHSMLVDLLRNDLGHIAEYGSVKVRDFARIEKYSSVMHLVSDIVAKLRPEKNVFDILRALFPGGTITGAPKVETMDILGRLEKSARGLYCGSAGYISFNGNADFNILIRTLQKVGRKMEMRAGGGIVIDSNPSLEYAESIQKALGVIAPLGEIATLPRDVRSDR